MTTGTWKWPRLHTRRLLTVILIGTFLSFYAAFAIRSTGLEKSRAQFENEAGGYVALISSAFKARQQEIGALHRFFEGSTFVSLDEFRRFIEPFMAEGASALAIEWIPLVTADERSAFEAEISDGDSSEGLITEYDDQGALVRAADRNFYFPIRYAEPLEKNKVAIGLDLASDAISLQAMEKALDSAMPVFVPQARFSQQEQDQYTFRILYSVYRERTDSVASRRSNLMGFVAGVYRCADIVETAFSPVPPAGLDVTVSNIDDEDDLYLLYVHPSRTRSKEMPFSADALGGEVSMRYRDTVSLADRTLEIACTPAPGYPGIGIFWSPWLVLFGGFMLTGLFTVHLNLLMTRNRKVTALVDEQTEALRESRTRLELALSGADLGYWEWRVQDGGMIFSRRWAEMIGYSTGDLESNVRAWRRVIHSDDREKVLEALRRHLQGLSPRFECEYRLRHRDGHYIWVLNRGRIIEWDESGRALRACGTHLDITSRKLANQARDLLAAAVEQFGEALIITDSKGRIQYVNSAFERISGFTRAEVVGDFPHLLPGAEQDKDLFPKINETLVSGKTWQGVIDSRSKDGTLYYEKATISPVFDENGNITHHVAVRHDLTDLKRLEEEKNKMEMQYHQAQKLESIGRLAGGVAHDLNNLLGPILGYTEMNLEKTDTNDERYEGLEVIRKSALRARDVVRQLLAFSRKQSLSIQNVDLSSVVEGFKDLLRRTLLENIRIEYKLHSPLTIKADIGQLEQILMNLAVNAQDAMPEGGLIVIETDAAVLDADHIKKRTGAKDVKSGSYAMLQVNDTGHGMEQMILDYVFEPFFSTKEKGKGTGLGLAMVYGTVKQHGGYIWADSEPGRGTSFKIYFPLLDTPAQMSPQDEDPEPYTGDETIMVVEDDQSIRKMAMQMLSRKGYHVMAAESGAKCLEMLERLKEPVDVLLTDVIMPDMNGKELYTKIKERYQEIKVIYMSGYTDDIIAHHGVFSGEVPFIQKPFSVRDLTAKIRSVVDGEA